MGWSMQLLAKIIYYSKQSNFPVTTAPPICNKSLFLSNSLPTNDRKLYLCSQSWHQLWQMFVQHCSLQKREPNNTVINTWTLFNTECRVWMCAVVMQAHTSNCSQEAYCESVKQVITRSFVSYEVFEVLEHLLLHRDTIVVTDWVLSQEVKLHHKRFPIQFFMESWRVRVREEEV